jgi:acyl dehydratase
MENSKTVLAIGDKDYFWKTVGESDIYTFAGITGDFFRLHVDEAYAKNTRFGRRIAYGLLSDSFVAGVLGGKLPGSGSIMLEHYVEFKRPVFIGDSLEAAAELIKVEEKKTVYIAEFDVSCTNQNGEVVLTGNSRHMLPKNYFLVQQPQLA